MARNYSRLASVEEKRNIRKAIFYILISILAAVFLFFLGLPTLIKLAGFLGELGKSNKPVEQIDITPPAPPTFDNLPEFTNKKSLQIQGSAEEGAVITLKINGNTQETVASSENRFFFEINLENGQNNISATAKDTSGNLSQESQVYKVIFDDQKPELTIESPKDGDIFFGSSQRQIVIKGTTDTDAQIYINDRFVSVNEDSQFTFTTSLTEGQNSFKISSVDKAGNQEEKSISVTYSP